MPDRILTFLKLTAQLILSYRASQTTCFCNQFMFSSRSGKRQYRRHAVHSKRKTLHVECGSRVIKHYVFDFLITPWGKYPAFLVKNIKNYLSCSQKNHRVQSWEKLPKSLPLENLHPRYFNNAFRLCELFRAIPFISTCLFYHCPFHHLQILSLIPVRTEIKGLSFSLLGLL